MNKNEANIEAKKIYDKWRKDKEAAEKKAKEEGMWNTSGLDSNNHIFKEIDEKAKEKLKALELKVDAE